MNIAGFFGRGQERLLSSGDRAAGRVLRVYRCWWLKVNTEPVRRDPMDGALFPHVIRFCYVVNGVEYTGRRWVSPYARCPRQAQEITVFYDRERPDRWAVELT